MRFVIVTGMSGAGKTAVLKMLEDMHFFCVDNLPIELIGKFAALMLEARSEDVKDIALGIDARSGSTSDEIYAELKRLTEIGYNFQILFLDASDRVLVKRYKETRRKHPLAPNGRIEIGIQEERKQLGDIRNKADYLIDTSHLLTRELKAEIEKIFVENKSFNNMMITVLSFGFKYGIPADADLVFDVRFLPNPYYIDELRPLTGMSDQVFDYVMKSDDAKEFAESLENMMKFLIPRYASEGKNNLVIAIGCTGGKHRSVTMARELYRRLSGTGEYGFRLEHRDSDKDRLIGK